MDQPKIERMLRVMQLFSSNTKYTLDELSDKLGISKRSLFRYIDTFKNAGFVVQRIDEGVYKMTTYNKEYSDLSQLVYFSQEEAIVVSRLIENLSSTNAMKAGLKQKLAAVYDSTSIGDYREQKGKSDEIDALAKAIKEKRRNRWNWWRMNPPWPTRRRIISLNPMPLRRNTLISGLVTRHPGTTRCSRFHASVK